MIKITRAENESRARDKKRKRYILQIGTTLIHLTRKELQDLRFEVVINLAIG